MGRPGPEEVDEGHARGGTGLFVDRSDVAIERGARKEECRRHVLHAVVRNDQRAYIEIAANFAVKNTTKKPVPR